MERQRPHLASPHLSPARAPASAQSARAARPHNRLDSLTPHAPRPRPPLPPPNSRHLAPSPTSASPRNGLRQTTAHDGVLETVNSELQNRHCHQGPFAEAAPLHGRLRRRPARHPRARRCGACPRPPARCRGPAGSRQGQQRLEPGAPCLSRCHCWRKRWRCERWSRYVIAPCVIVFPIDWVRNPLLRVVQVSLPTAIHLFFPYDSSVLPVAL
jgi:hypothetical protein